MSLKVGVLTLAICLIDSQAFKAVKSQSSELNVGVAVTSDALGEVTSKSNASSDLEAFAASGPSRPMDMGGLQVTGRSALRPKSSAANTASMVLAGGRPAQAETPGVVGRSRLGTGSSSVLGSSGASGGQASSSQASRSKAPDLTMAAFEQAAATAQHRPAAAQEEEEQEGEVDDALSSWMRGGSAPCARKAGSVPGGSHNSSQAAEKLSAGHRAALDQAYDDYDKSVKQGKIAASQHKAKLKARYGGDVGAMTRFSDEYTADEFRPKSSSGS